MQNSKEELKELVMELYLKYGGRPFSCGDLDDWSDLCHKGCIKWTWDLCTTPAQDLTLVSLTPKALELIRGETE